MGRVHPGVGSTGLVRVGRECKSAVSPAVAEGTPAEEQYCLRTRMDPEEVGRNAQVA